MEFKGLFLAIVSLSSVLTACASADSGESRIRLFGHPSSRRLRPVVGSRRPVGRYDDEYEVPRYQFAYKARAGGGYSPYVDGDDSSEFGHAETRDGDRTEGQYFVLLPDGRRQTVNYVVDGDRGYVAHVSYSDYDNGGIDYSGYRK